MLKKLINIKTNNAFVIVIAILFEVIFIFFMQLRVKKLLFLKNLINCLKKLNFNGSKSKSRFF